MFDGIFEAIENWMRDLLTGMVTSNLTTMFTDVNEKTGEIASQVGQTPQGWNSSIFSLIQNLSNSVIIPIAGMIITFVLCYELISMLTEKNNMHEIDTWMFFKYFFKMWVAVWMVSNTFTITMAVFDVGQYVVNAAGGVISSDTAINVDSMLEAMNTAMESMNIGELVVLALESMLVSLCMKILSVLITVILYGRMIEIYLYTSVAPIPCLIFTILSVQFLTFHIKSERITVHAVQIIFLTWDHPAALIKDRFHGGFIILEHEIALSLSIIRIFTGDMFQDGHERQLLSVWKKVPQRGSGDLPPFLKLHVSFQKYLQFPVEYTFAFPENGYRRC